MRGNGARLRPSLRETLATSRVGAVAIAVLLFWALSAACQILWLPLLQIGDYIAQSGILLGVFGQPPHGFLFGPTYLLGASFYLFSIVMSLAAAWLLSRWLYGGGPIRVLKTYRALLDRRNHA